MENHKDSYLHIISYQLSNADSMVDIWNGILITNLSTQGFI